MVWWVGYLVLNVLNGLLGGYICVYATLHLTSTHSLFTAVHWQHWNTRVVFPPDFLFKTPLYTSHTTHSPLPPPLVNLFHLCSHPMVHMFTPPIMSTPPGVHTHLFPGLWCEIDRTGCVHRCRVGVRRRVFEIWNIQCSEICTLRNEKFHTEIWDLTP